MSAALPLAVYCAGGPLDGYGFTDKDWRRRLEAATNLGSGAALGYVPSSGYTIAILKRRPKVQETLAGWDVTCMRWHSHEETTDPTTDQERLWE